MAMLTSMTLTAASPVAKPLQIVALGDSLTAGFGLPDSGAFPTVLAKRLHDDGFDVRVSNAGVSGDTATGGLGRLDWSVPDGTDLVIVELGANDMLRDIAPQVARDALEKILANLRARRVPAVLAGMKSLANWGEQYRADFERIYPDLSAQYGVPLYPFFLDGVSGHPELTLDDGLHPNAAGVRVIVDKFAPFLEHVLRARFGPAAAGASN